MRLIIQHGKRVTRHEIKDKSIVIGRDPSCDLFFADQKLSRRHARVEPTAEGVKLADLGSRNGCWVNDESVGACLLQKDDRLRLGGLRMTFEVDTPQPDDQGEGAFFETGSGSETLQLNMGAVGPAKQPPALPDDTVLFDELDEGNRVHEPPQAAIGGEVGEVSRSAPPLTGTNPMDRQVVFEAPPDLPASWNLGEARGLALTQPLLVSLAFALIAYLVLAFPLAVWTSNTLREESLSRGRSLLRLLGASNSLSLGSGSMQDLSVSVVEGERGVRDALIMGPGGRILAPPERAGESVDILEGIDEPVREISAFIDGKNATGDFNMAIPITSGGRRVGVAALTLSPPQLARGSFLLILLVVGLLIILIGAASAILLAKRRLRALSAVASEPTIAELP